MRFFKIFLLTAIILSTVIYATLFFNVSEELYNKIMCYYLARKITADKDSFKGKVFAIRDFVNQNIHPIAGYKNRLDTVAIDKLLSGIGWCDQQTRVFMQICRSANITTRLLFLRTKEGLSVHSVAEVLTPEGKWGIIDVSHRLSLLTDDGRIACQKDIMERHEIIYENKRVKLRSRYEPRWKDPDFISIYYNEPTYVTTKKGAGFGLFRLLPVPVLHKIADFVQKKYLNQIRQERDIYEFKILLARGKHLLGFYNEAVELYDMVIKNSDNQKLIWKAEFYKAVLLEEHGFYKKALEFTTYIVQREDSDINPYLKFFLGLRSRIYKNMGLIDKMEDDLKRTGYDLEV